MRAAHTHFLSCVRLTRTIQVGDSELVITRVTHHKVVLSFSPGISSSGSSSSHLISFHLISPSHHLISAHLISSHLISSHLISSHLISSHLVSSHLISSHLISSHLISSHHLISSSHLILSHQLIISSPGTSLSPGMPYICWKQTTTPRKQRPHNLNSRDARSPSRALLDVKYKTLKGRVFCFLSFVSINREEAEHLPVDWHTKKEAEQLPVTPALECLVLHVKQCP